MTDYLPGYDLWKCTNPDDEFLGPEPEDEDDLPPEPEVTEVWDGIDDYVFQVTFPSRHQFTVMQAKAGPFVGDWEIHGPNDFFSDGFLSPEKAIDWLCDPERRDW